MTRPVTLSTSALRAWLAQSLPAYLRYPTISEQLDAWQAALQRGIGAERVDRARLTAAFDRASQDRATRAERGDLLPADVLLAYGRIEPAREGERIWSSCCDRGCHHGMAEMVAPDGYEVLVPCDCEDGEHQRRRLLIFRADVSPVGSPRREPGNEVVENVGDRLRQGWQLRLHEYRGVSAEEARWCNDQLDGGRPLRVLLVELWRARQAGAQEGVT